MSFELQQDGASCGTESLRYALSLLGFGLVEGNELDAADLLDVLGKPKWQQLLDGTGEDEIPRAARTLGLEVAFHPFKTPDSKGFIDKLRAVTGKGHPCVATFHDNTRNHYHWVCVGGFDGSDVLLFDPNLEDWDNVPTVLFNPVDSDGEHAPARMAVRRFEEWITPSKRVSPEEDHHFFMEFWPAEDHQHRFVPGGITGELLDEMREDDDLCQHFDEYIDDLRSMFGAPSTVPEGRSAHEFLRENERRLLEIARDWTLPEQRPFFDREMRNLLAITKAYRFWVAPSDEATVLARVAFYLAWQGCEHAYEVGRYE